MYVAYIMKRTQIYLESDQDRRLARRAASAGTTKSMLIREAIESYLSSSDEASDRVYRFRAALDAAARKPIEFEDGATYVERLRAVDEERRRESDRRGS